MRKFLKYVPHRRPGDGCEGPVSCDATASVTALRLRLAFSLCLSALPGKPARSVEKKWRELNGHELMGDVVAGIFTNDGIK